MTLLTRSITFYFRCTRDSTHRFERSTADALTFCPTCHAPVRLYGLKDTTLPDTLPDD